MIGKHLEASPTDWAGGSIETFRTGTDFRSIRAVRDLVERLGVTKEDDNDDEKGESSVTITLLVGVGG